MRTEEYKNRFQHFVDTVQMPCCVMSCRENDDGSCGEIRILCANRSYKETMGPAYYDNMPYYELVPKDNKFEDFVFQSAINGKRMHAYVETKALKCWTDQTLIPLRSDDEKLGFCQFIFEFTKSMEADRMADVSLGLAELIIRSCVNLMASDDFLGSLHTVLSDMKNASEAEGARIMLIDREKKEAVILCEELDEDAWTTRDVTQPDVIDYDLICSWEKVLGISNNIILKDESDMKMLELANAEWAKSMQEAGVKSLALTPLRRNGEVIGYFYLANVNVDKISEIKELVEIMAFFIGSEISNYLLVNKLDEMSHSDALTGLNNRHSMMQKIRRMNEEPYPLQFGIVNLDLNGLKYVNDTMGHDQGDAMLIQATNLILSIFRHDEVYRIGGDEFIIIAEGMSEETLRERIKKLRTMMSDNPGLCFAIGACWSDGSEDPSEVLKKADDLMYQDKHKYYSAHPDYMRK